MKYSFDPNLVETTVFLAARRLATTGDARLERALHQRIDPLYEHAQASARDAEFREAYAALFTSNRLAAPLESLLSERPCVTDRVQQCVVRSVGRARDETLELFVKPNPHGIERTLVISLRPETLLDAAHLFRIYRHELQHVVDMLDDHFDYDPSAEPQGATGARRRLVHDRFCVLWDVYIDGRLARRGQAADELRGRRADQFRKVFDPAAQHEARCDRAFEWVWNAEALKHADLLRWAQTPETLLDAARISRTRAAPHVLPGERRSVSTEAGTPSGETGSLREHA